MTRILTILAHPDDAEIWAGGTIARHVRDGAEAVICSLTGDSSSTRAREAAEGAAVLGAQVTLLGEEDRHLRQSDDLVQVVSSLLVDVAPSIIITHWEEDSHPDHVQANAITRAAIVATAGRSQQIDLLLACDTYLGSGRAGLFNPDLTVDIGEVWEQKVEAISKHLSQEPDHYLQAIERQCWLHGARAKVGYAEGFQRLPLYGRLGGAVRHLGRSEQ